MVVALTEGVENVYTSCLCTRIESSAFCGAKFPRNKFPLCSVIRAVKVQYGGAGTKVERGEHKGEEGKNIGTRCKLQICGGLPVLVLGL